MAPEAAAPAASGNSAPAGSIEDYFDRLDAAFSTLDTSTVLTAGGAAAGGRDTAGDSPSGDPSTPMFGGLGDALAGWDPDITGDPSRPAPPPLSLPPLDIGWTPAPTSFEPPSASPETTAAPPPVPAPAHEAPPRASEPPVAADAPTAPYQSPATFQAPSSAPPAPPSLAEAFAALLAAEQGRPFSPAAAQQARLDEHAMEEITRRVLDRMSDRVVKETVADLAERLVREEIDRIKSAAR